MESYENAEISVRDYLRTIFRYKLLIVIVVLIAVSAMLIKRELVTQYYTASVKMLIYGQKIADVEHFSKILQPRGLLNIASDIVTYRTIVERVVKALKLYERPIDEELKYASRLKRVLIKPKLKELKLYIEGMNPEDRQKFLFNLAVERLQNNISPSFDEDTFALTFNIVVKDYNPALPQLIANAVSRSFIIFDFEQQIAEKKLKYGEKYKIIVQLQNYIDQLQKTLDGRLLPDVEAIGPASVKILEQAHGASLIKGITNKQIVITFIASIVFGVLLALIFDLLDQAIKTPHELEKLLNIPVLGSIPKINAKNKILISDNSSDNMNYSKSFQNLSEQVYLLMKDIKLKAILITCIEDSQDINHVIVNLGYYLSNVGGRKVLIIDANLRRPAISKILNVKDSPGLIEVIKGEITLKDAVRDMGANLNVLPTRKPASNPITFLDSLKMKEVVSTCSELYDIVLVASADLKSFSDSIHLSSKVGGTVLLIDEGKTNKQVAKRLVSPFEQNKSNIIGAIFNNRTYVIPSIIYKIT